MPQVYSSQPLHEGRTNDSRVYQALARAGRPLTIAEVNSAVEGVVEKTVRRAIAGLIRDGFVVEAGRAGNSGNAKLYTTVEASSADAKTKLIPFGNDRLTVEDFVKLMTGVNSNPFGTRLKTEPWSETFAQVVRTRLLFVIISSGEPGFNQQVETVHSALGRTLSELERLTDALRSFVNSPVWYDHHRDTIALAMRKLQQEDPGLYQLAMDYVNSGRNREA